MRSSQRFREKPLKNGEIEDNRDHRSLKNPLFMGVFWKSSGSRRKAMKRKKARPPIKAAGQVGGNRPRAGPSIARMVSYRRFMTAPVPEPNRSGIMLAARAAQKIALDQCLLNRMGILAGFPNRVAMDGSILTMQGRGSSATFTRPCTRLGRLPRPGRAFPRTPPPRSILTQSHSCAH